MTTIGIELPEQLALDAERARLLSPKLLENWLREQRKAQRVDQLFSAMDRMSAIEEPAVMSPEAVARSLRISAVLAFAAPGNTSPLPL
jgi:hypothetical protein